GRQMQNLQIEKVGAPWRMPLLQLLPGPAEDQSGKEVIPESIIAKATGFAQETINDVPVVDVMGLGPDSSGQPLYPLAGIVDIDRPFLDVDSDLSTHQRRGHRVGLFQN